MLSMVRARGVATMRCYRGIVRLRGVHRPVLSARAWAGRHSGSWRAKPELNWSHWCNSSAQRGRGAGVTEEGATFHASTTHAMERVIAASARRGERTCGRAR